MELTDLNFAELAEVVPPSEVREGITAVERSLWATIKAQNLKMAYLKAYSTSYNRYQLASTMKDGGAMVRQADAMVKFADLALQTGRKAALQWYEFEQFSVNELEKVQATFAEKGIPWEDALDGWCRLLQTEGPPAELREVLIAAQAPAAESETFKKQMHTLTPTVIQEMLAGFKEKIKSITQVREKLSAMNSQANWPEPPDIAALERFQQNARSLLRQVLQTRIILSLDPAGKKPLAWWPVPTGSPPRLLKASAFNVLNSDPLAPGTYDIYIVQDQESLNRQIPLALRIARDVQVIEGQSTEIFLQTGLRLVPAEGFPKPLSWFVMLSDSSSTSIVAHSAGGSLEPLWLPPGQYDVYWVQDYDHRDNPMLVAGSVVVPSSGILTLEINSGIRLDVEDWVLERDASNGWWGVTRVGEPTSRRINWTKTADPLLLPEGNYDIYWMQDYDHREKPLLLIRGLEVKANEITIFHVDTGIRLEVSDWVPKRDERHGWWGATLVGKSPDEPINWSHSNDPLLLAPGQYDVYWKQDYDHKPMLLAGGIEINEDAVITIPAMSGLRLKVPANTPALDANHGWWGVIPESGEADQRIHWAKGHFDQPLLVPPGAYDIVWKQDYNHQPLKIKQGVIIVQANVLLEVDVQPPGS